MERKKGMTEGGTRLRGDTLGACTRETSPHKLYRHSGSERTLRSRVKEMVALSLSGGLSK